MTAIHIDLSAMNFLAESLRVHFGQFTYDPGGTLGPRRQRNLQLVLLHQGCARIEVDPASQPVVHHLTAETAVLLFPGELEFFTFDETGISYHTWIDFGFKGQHGDLSADSIWAGLLGGPLASQAALRDTLLSLRKVVPVSQTLAETVRAGLALQSSQGPIAQQVRDHLARAAFAEWYRLATGEPRDTTAPLPRPVERALHVLHQEFRSEIQGRDLARRAGISEQHLARLFRQHLGTTPAAALWEQRLEEAKTLLLQSGLSVSEVAYRSGFRTPYHFSRRFRDETGKSPSAWRRAQWG